MQRAMPHDLSKWRWGPSANDGRATAVTYLCVRVQRRLARRASRLSNIGWRVLATSVFLRGGGGSTEQTLKPTGGQLSRCQCSATASGSTAHYRTEKVGTANCTRLNHHLGRLVEPMQQTHIKVARVSSGGASADLRATQGATTRCVAQAYRFPAEWRDRLGKQRGLPQEPAFAECGPQSVGGCSAPHPASLTPPLPQRKRHNKAQPRKVTVNTECTPPIYRQALAGMCPPSVETPSAANSAGLARTLRCKRGRGTT